MKQIDEVLAQAVARGVAPGLVAAVATDRGVIYHHAVGTRGLGDARPMEKDSVFWIHSMTKAIATVACMQQVEAGMLALDDDVGRLVPQLAAPRVLAGFTPEGAPILRPAAGAITLRQLLTHTSGFAYDMWNANMLRYGKGSSVPRNMTFDSAENCLPLSFDPGTSWAYGVGIDWAGKVLEAVTGTSLDAYLRTRIFAPLGMPDTGYALRPEIVERMAGFHRREADGSLTSSPITPSQNPAYFMGGGGLYSTAGDYLRFLSMLLGGGSFGGTQFLAPETVALMGQNHIGDIAVSALKTVDPARTNDADFFPGMMKKWGLSFLINTQDVPGRRAAGSLAWAGLANTYFWLDPTRRVAGVIMAQMLPFADPAVLDTLVAFEKAVYAAL